MTLHWNTGRMYTRFGQRISAVKIGDMIWFKDHDRLIIGTVITSAPLTQELVMTLYDNNRYRLPNSRVPEVIQHFTSPSPSNALN